MPRSSWTHDGTQEDDRKNPPTQGRQESFREEKLRIVDRISQMDGVRRSARDVLDTAAAAAGTASPRLTSPTEEERGRDKRMHIPTSQQSSSRRDTGDNDGLPGAVNVRGDLSTTIATEASSQNQGQRNLKQQQLQAATQVLQDHGTDVSTRVSASGSTSPTEKSRAPRPFRMSAHPVEAEECAYLGSSQTQATSSAGVTLRDPEPSPISRMSDEEENEERRQQDACFAKRSRRMMLMLGVSVVVLVAILATVLVLVFSPVRSMMLQTRAA
mmetsp:Transcript_40708/g.60327  ORF Transcript_40708/g.60327 Transcript_40708/m.60327 type:complete len:271 (-) Transcript_40708:1467-2279(-)